MKNIVLTACALMLAGSISDVRAEEISAYGEIGTNNQICASKDSSCSATDKFTAPKGTEWIVEIVAKETSSSTDKSKRAKDDGQKVYYTITTTITNKDQADEKISWVWKKLGEVPNMSSFNIAACVLKGSNGCLAGIIQDNMSIKIENLSEDKRPGDEDKPKYKVTSNFEKCGGTCTPESSDIPDES